MKSRNNLKLKEIKEKCKKLIEEEAKKQDVELNIEPITIVEYYDSDVFKEKTTIEKTMTKLVLANVGGLFDTETQKIIIFTDRMGKGQKVESPNKLAASIFASYHEFKHQLQYLDKETTETEQFIIALENVIKTFFYKEYRINHDKYYMEIDANLYALNKTNEYFSQYEPELYPTAKEYLTEKWEKSTLKHLANYNFQKTFTKFYLVYLFKGINLNSLNIPGVEIFINKDNHFRNPKDILERFKQSNLDDNIFTSILSSNIYIRDLNIKTLTQEDKDILSNVLIKELEKINNTVINNNKNNENKKEKTINYLKSTKNIFKKIAYLYKQSPDIIEIIRNKTQNKFLKSKTKKLQKINKQIKTDNV